MPCLTPRLIRGLQRPCGKCVECFSWWREKWIRRAALEVEFASKSWYCTFTHRPGTNTEYSDIQKFFKRLRKNTGEKVTYLCVLERGSKGTKRLHWHLFIHGNVTWRQIDKEWKLGFNKMNIIKKGRKGVRSYVLKYVTKQAKPRTSQGYGSRYVKQASESELIQHAARVFGKVYINKLSELKTTPMAVLCAPAPIEVSELNSDPVQGRLSPGDQPAVLSGGEALREAYRLPSTTIGGPDPCRTTLTKVESHKPRYTPTGSLTLPLEDALQWTRERTRLNTKVRAREAVSHYLRSALTLPNLVTLVEVQALDRLAVLEALRSCGSTSPRTLRGLKAIGLVRGDPNSQLPTFQPGRLPL